MNKEINILKNEPLEANIFEKLGIKLVLWEDLLKYKIIDEILPCVLYMPILNKYQGHYVFLWKVNDTLMYFCSYGYNLNFAINKSYYLLETPIRDEDYLNVKIIDFIKRGGKISFNPYRFQGKNENLSTCGRYCIIRFLKMNLNHEEFKKWFSYSSLNNDDLITLLTFVV